MSASGSELRVSNAAKWRELIVRSPPVLVVVALCLANPLLAFLMERELFGHHVFSGANRVVMSLQYDSAKYIIGLAILTGEAIFATVVAGFAHRRWLHSYLVGLGFALLFWATFMCGLSWYRTDVKRYAPSSICFLPTLLLAAACPLFAVRQVLGWRVNRSDDAAARLPLRIKEWLLVIALLPAVLVFVRVPRFAWEIDDATYWPTLAITAGAVATGSLMLIPGTVWLVLKAPLRWHVMSAKIGLLIAASVVVWEVNYPSTVPEGAARVIQGTVALFATVYVSLIAVRISGRTAVRHKSRELPLDTRQNRYAEIGTWSVVGVAILLAGITNTYLAPYERERAVREQAQAEARRQRELTAVLHTYARSRGGHYTPSQLRLGMDATATDLQYFAERVDSLSGLHLTQAGLTDDELSQFDFPALTYFGCENMPVSDVALDCLAKSESLAGLSLRHTRFTGSGLGKIALPLRLTTLDCSGSPFNDDGCRELHRFTRLIVLSLDDTPITDEGVAEISQLNQVRWLSMAGTDASPAGLQRLSSLRNLTQLNLRQTATDDRLFDESAFPQMAYLQADDTDITDRTLQSLASRPLIALRVSNTSVTDTGVVALKDSEQLQTLDLAGTQVTGTCFRDWRPLPGVMQVNLARTPIDNDGVRALLARKTEACQLVLGLAGTRITDAILADLAYARLRRLDLRNTSVTVAGLLDASFRGTKLTITKGQFSTEDIRRLRQQMAVDERPDISIDSSW